MAVRAIRGATRLDVDEREHLLTRTTELVDTIFTRNGLDPDDVISIFLTATPDLTSEFPAAAVRTMGFTNIPLMCAQEIDVEGAMGKVVRVMLHVENDTSRDDIHHVYLHGTSALRNSVGKVES